MTRFAESSRKNISVYDIISAKRVMQRSCINEEAVFDVKWNDNSYINGAGTISEGPLNYEANGSRY